MSSFKHLMWSVPKGGSTESEVQAAAAIVKKEEQTSLSTFEKLKLSKAAPEGGGETFAFFETNSK